MNYKKIIKLKYLALVLFFPIGLTFAINTISEGYKSTTSTSIINAHGKCRAIKQSGLFSYFIPTKTLSEWNSFINNAAGEIIVDDGFGTGGIINEYSSGGITYRVHTFNGNGTFSTLCPITVDVFIVGGGGGGGIGDNGPSGGGGGGAGGVRSINNISLTGSSNFNVVIGAGGAPSTNGGYSEFINSTYRSLGGGAGGDGFGGASNGSSGGSGGGAGGRDANPTPGAGTAGQGYTGGNEDSILVRADCSVSDSRGNGGGGGGAGEVGNSNGNGKGGDGIIGPFDGLVYGNGGDGGTLNGRITGTSGTSNTGDGGNGGGGWNSCGSTHNGGSGGSGIIKIRYRIN